MYNLWTVTADIRTGASLNVAALVVTAKDSTEAVEMFHRIFSNNNDIVQNTIVAPGIDRTNKAITGLYNPELLNRVEEGHASLCALNVENEDSKIHLFGKFTFTF